eukprot:s1508_g18.t1
MGTVFAGSAPGVHLLAGAQVQLVMQRIKTPAPTPAATAGPPPDSVAATHPSLMKHWRPLPEPCPAGAWEKLLPFPACQDEVQPPLLDSSQPKLNEEVEQLLHLATELTDWRKAASRRAPFSAMELRMEEAKVLNRFRPMGLQILRRFKERYAQKLRVCLQLRRRWRSPPSMARRALRRRRFARLQLQSWFRGIFGRRAAYRRYRALRAFGPLARVVLGPLHCLQRTRLRICAAICIATYWRGSCARAELARRRAALRSLQAAVCAGRPRRQLEEFWAAAVVIQPQLRRFLHRRALQRFRKMKFRLAQLQDSAQQVVRDANATLTSRPVPGGKGRGKKKPIPEELAAPEVVPFENLDASDSVVHSDAGGPGMA